MPRAFPRDSLKNAICDHGSANGVMATKAVNVEQKRLFEETLAEDEAGL